MVSLVIHCQSLYASFYILVSEPDANKNKLDNEDIAGVSKIKWKIHPTDNFTRDEQLEINSFVSISYLKLAGIGKDDEIHKLFIRECAMEAYKYLCTNEQGFIIHGPPGTGKSIITWFWVLQQVKFHQKTVIWIHVSNNEHICLKLSQKEFFITQTILINNQILDLIRFSIPGQINIIVLDGVACNNNFQSEFVTTLNNWRNYYNGKGIQTVQTVLVSSLSFKVCESDQYQIQPFLMYPWIFEEYKSACENEEFFKSIKNFMENETYNEEMLNNKFYFAGASARWMFSTKTTEVISLINNYIDRLDLNEKLLNFNMGDKNPMILNHLIMQFPYKVNQQYFVPKRFFVSEFACKTIILRGNASLLNSSYLIAKDLKNKSFLGWLFEIDVIKQLQTNQNILINEKSAPDSTNQHQLVVNNMSGLIDVSPNMINNDLEKMLSGIWCRPAAFNQTGFDLYRLVEISSQPTNQTAKSKKTNKLIKKRFLLDCYQITIAQKHSLKVNAINKLANQINNALERDQFEITNILITFVWPNNKIEYKIENPENGNALNNYKINKSDIFYKNNILDNINKIVIAPSFDINF